jgi:LysM repeat protein
MTMPIGDPDPARQARAAAAAEEAQRKALEAGQSTAAEAPAGAEAAKASAAAPASEAAAKGPVLPADLYTETGAEAPDKGQPGAEKVAKASGGDFMNKLSTGKKGAGLAVLALVKNIVRQADQALRETEAKREAPGDERAEPESRTHKLQPGDSLWKVAKSHGVSLEALRAANPGLAEMDDRKLPVGLELALPPGAKAPDPPAEAPPSAAAARPVPAEGAKPTPAGSQAAVPEAGAQPAASRTHKLQPGDSLWKVAKSHGVSLEALRAANPGLAGMDDRKLPVGLELALPPGAKSPDPPAEAPPSAAAARPVPAEDAKPTPAGSQAAVPEAGAQPAASQTHKLQPGDSLWKVAKSHGVSLEALRAANPGLAGMDDRKLPVGLELALPPEARAPVAGDVPKPDAANKTRRDPTRG